MDNFISLGNYKVRIKRNSAIRHLSLRMSPGKGIWLNIPYGTGAPVVESFLKDKQEWIEKNLAVYEKLSPLPQHAYGEVIRIGRKNFRLLQGDRFAVDETGMENVVYVPGNGPQEEFASRVEKAVVSLYKREAAGILPGRVAFLAEKYGFRYGKLSFRNNVSNWGSCSCRNNISLNIRLLDFPEEVADYVILHELCHTKVKNHSEKFWNLVAEVCPDYKKLRKQLNKK